MQGIEADDEKTECTLSDKSMLKVVDNVVDILKSENPQIIVVAQDDEKLVTEAVEKGVYGVSVSPKLIKDMRKLVAQQEAELILSK
jgi:hypothetical protein